MFDSHLDSQPLYPFLMVRFPSCLEAAEIVSNLIPVDARTTMSFNLGGPEKGHLLGPVESIFEYYIQPPRLFTSDINLF